MLLNTKSDKDCIESARKSRRSLTNAKFNTFDHSIFTVGDKNDFSLYVFYYLCKRFENIVDISDVRQTFEYIFKYIKKGHFVFYGGECKHLPLSNYYFTNPFFEKLFVNESDKKYLKKLKFALERIKTHLDLRRYLYMEEKSNAYIRNTFFKSYKTHFRNVYYERRKWVSNGCFFRMEKYEGDKFYNLYDYFFNELFNEIRRRNNDLNDYLFFANIRDFPIVRKDGRYPYTNIVLSKKLDILPRLPIFSLCSSLEHLDIPMPTPDDLHFIYDDILFPPLLCKRIDKDMEFEWNRKKKKVVFRGSATGCFIDSNNSRIRGFEITKNHGNIFDYGITNFNRRIKKPTPESNISYLSSSSGLIESDTMTAGEISGFRFILVLEGHVGAFRLSYNLFMKSCVLLQESKYVLWYSQLLKPYVHYVPVKNDLSDLVERAKWCLKNDKICQKISENGHETISRILTKNHVYGYMHEILRKSSLYHPLMVRSPEKNIALISIYRDTSSTGYRKRQKDKFIDFFRRVPNIDVYIVEQGKEHEFNIGLLKNIGFHFANKKKTYDHFIFSDVDLLPDDELFEYYKNPKHFPLSLAYRGTIYENFEPSEYMRMYETSSNVENNARIFQDNYLFIGGVCVFDKASFLKINGYPNSVWGWGGEDEILLLRIYQKYGEMYYPKKGRVIDLEEGNFDIKKKRVIQKREKEDTNKLKYELLSKYSSSSVFKEDGVKNVENYFRVHSTKSVFDNVIHIYVDLDKHLLEKIESSGDYKKMYREFRTQIKKMIYIFV